jgi:hypothetical protein
MADSIEPEFIPNPDLLFCRVHKAQFNFKENRISRAVFGKVDQSADWSKYSSREETAGRHKKPQDIKAVACITAEACRRFGQEVIHVPLAMGEPGGPNVGHTEIRGEKSDLVLSQLRDAIAELWPNPRFMA